MLEEKLIVAEVAVIPDTEGADTALPPRDLAYEEEGARATIENDKTPKSAKGSRLDFRIRYYPRFFPPQVRVRENPAKRNVYSET